MIAAMLVALAQASLPSMADIRGQWINERGTAIIHIADCPSGLCGTIVWSSAAARSDAARGGTAELNGTEVMSGFVALSGRRWRGKLFLPDHNRTVKADIELQDKDLLRVKGCEVAGLVCRSQRWIRRPAG
jgi:uncharacterized protein (DUF2147 family)